MVNVKKLPLTVRVHRGVGTVDAELLVRVAISTARRSLTMRVAASVMCEVKSSRPRPECSSYARSPYNGRPVAGYNSLSGQCCSRLPLGCRAPRRACYLGGLGRDGLVFFVMDAFPSSVEGDRHFGFNLKTALTECP